MSGNYWRQTETRIDKKGDKGRQDFGKADTPSNTGTRVGRQWERMENNGGQWETRGDKTPRGRARDPRKGNKKIGDNGRRQGETRPWEGGHTIPSGRRTHHPTRRNKNGHNRRQREAGKADTPSNKGKQGGVQWETSGESHQVPRLPRKGRAASKATRDKLIKTN